MLSVDLFYNFEYIYITYTLYIWMKLDLYDALKMFMGLRAFLVSFMWINSQAVQSFSNVIYELDEQTLPYIGNRKFFYKNRTKK